MMIIIGKFEQMKMKYILKLIMIAATVALVLPLLGCAYTVSSRGDAYELSDYNVGRDNFDPQCPALAKRVILLDGGVNVESANTICKQILYLNGISQTEPITIWLNSPGGNMTAYLQIINIITSTPAPVNIVNTGLCASAGVGIMQAATGTRYTFDNSYFILHASTGSPKDLNDKFNEHIERLFKEHTKIPKEWLPFGTKEYTLTAQEALEYDIVDEVVESYRLF